MVSAVLLLAVFLLNFSVLTQNTGKEDFDLASLISVNVANAEGDGGDGGSKKCRTGATSFPFVFWKRHCSDCRTHFSHYAGRGNCN